MNKGRLFIISGPSGSGKDTILAEVFKKMPELKFSISTITRPMRKGEIEGEKYHFTTNDIFEKMLEKGELLEHNLFVGNYYGTPKAPVENAINNGDDIIVEVDVNGAAQIREKVDDSVSVFILPPSLEVLKERLTKRDTDSVEAVKKRLECALCEINRADEYDYVVVNNEIPDAVNDVISIIKSDRLRIDRNIKLINEISNK